MKDVAAETAKKTTMKDVAAEMAKKATQKSRKAGNPCNESTALDRYYGQIGISAVAAAARYQGAARNPACAPVRSKWTTALAR